MADDASAANSSQNADDAPAPPARPAGSTPEGYEAMHSSASYCRLAEGSAVEVTGGDRISFLHNFCSNDLRRVEAGGGCEAYLLDVKGKVLAHMIVLVGDDRMLLAAGPGQSDQIANHLDRYVIREDVAVVDQSGATSWLLLNRAAAEAIAAALLPQLSSDWMHESVALGPAMAGIVRCSMTWLETYLLHIPAEQLEFVEARLAEAGAVAASEEAWETLRIEGGWPMWGRDFNAENLPQEVGRDAQAISFTKGCYLGQETVARIDALGHVNRRLATVRFNAMDVPAVGATLTSSDAVVGSVASACWSPQLAAPIALAMIRRGHNQVGAKLEAETGEAEVIATPAVSAGSPDAR